MRRRRVRQAWWRSPGETVDGRQNHDTTVPQAARDRHLESAVLELVDGARETVVLGTFILAHSDLLAAVLRASERGVRVYLITNAALRLKSVDPRMDELEASRTKQHKTQLDKLGGTAYVRSAAGFHAKFVVVDHATDPRGLLLTANLVVSDLRHNLEVGVPLTPEECRALVDQARWAFWEVATDELLGPGPLRSTRPLGEVAVPHPTEILAATREHTSLHESIAGELRASSSVIFTNFGWQHEHPIVEALFDALAEGTEVSIVARVAKPAARSFPVLLALEEAGAHVVGHERTHAKTCVFDTGTSIVHSHNYTVIDDPTSVELGVLLDGERHAALEKIVTDWLETAPWSLAGSAGTLRNPGRVIPADQPRWTKPRDWPE